MSSVQHMDRPTFLRDYELELEQEFERDGVAAQWAPNTSAHRFWGSEDASIALRADDPSRDRGLDDATAELSPDGRLVAVSTNGVIRIYDVHSQGVRAELIGHQINVTQLHFAPMTSHGGTQSAIDSYLTDGREETYHLFSSSSEGRDGKNEVIAWALDEEGRQVQRVMPFAIQNMADRAIAGISSDLAMHHGLSDSNIESIREGFSEALQIADTKNRTRNSRCWQGKFPSFGTYPVSPDGKHLLFEAHGKTTQHGMRPPDELPQIVVVDLATQAERCRLKGHKDAIMWAGWSPDGKTIATASWDQYYKIWDSSTGKCRYTIGPTKGQNWAGAFSPDGKYLLLSGGRKVQVAIYDVESGKEVVELKSESVKLEHWIRYFAWNPAGDCIAFCNGHNIILWHPFEDKVETILSLKRDGTMLTRFNGFFVIRWADGGKKLLLQDGDLTVFVWDREKNWKWRFQRPKGTPAAVYTSDICFVDTEEGGMVLSLNGDRKVRYWKL